MKTSEREKGSPMNTWKTLATEPRVRDDVGGWDW